MITLLDLKAILILVSTCNFGYLALLYTQLLVCDDVLHYKQLMKMSLKRRFKRFLLALGFPKYVTFLILCIACWTVIFRYMTEFREMIVVDKNWLYVIFAICISTGLIRLMHIFGYELELIKQIFAKNEKTHCRTDK